MNKYVISDLHGCYDEFIEMLSLINFKDTDILYILGDIFDRGNKPLEILDYIVTHKNIKLIKGNHEEMFIDYYKNGNASLWYYNGGRITHSEITMRDYDYEVAIYNYLKKLPYILLVDKFILVHAGLYFPQNVADLTIEDFISMQEEDTCLWDRSNIGNETKFKDYTVVCGHTPTMTIDNEAKILHRNGTIYIDCGCVFKHYDGRLACLRLDDMQEFYI